MRLYITCIFLCFHFSLVAQNNLQLHYGYRGSVGAAKFFPSTLHTGGNKLMVGFNYKVWVANKSLSYQTISDLRYKGTVTAEDISGFIEELDAENIIGFGQDALLLGVAFTAPIHDRILNISVGVSDRMSASFRYPRGLLELAWRGNAPFEGQTLDLSSMALDARYFREYAVGAAFNVFRLKDWRVRMGATLKYLHGLAAVYMPRNALFFTTGTNGDYLELQYNYDVMIAGMDDFSFFNKKGEGWGQILGSLRTLKSGIFLI